MNQEEQEVQINQEGIRGLSLARISELTVDNQELGTDKTPLEEDPLIYRTSTMEIKLKKSMKD